MSPIKLAITGNIGSGKTIVSHMLAIMGIPVYDCDTRAKMLMHNDANIKHGLVNMFGEECYSANGSLNREWLASRIFTDSDNIKRVNALVHPRVKEDFLLWASKKDNNIVAVESAILYESGMIDTVDKVLLVWADEDTSISRATKRGGLTRQQAISRLQRQMSADELLILSDYSICNDGDNAVLPKLIEIIEQLSGKNID